MDSNKQMRNALYRHMGSCKFRVPSRRAKRKECAVCRLFASDLTAVQCVRGALLNDYADKKASGNELRQSRQNILIKRRCERKEVQTV